MSFWHRSLRKKLIFNFKKWVIPYSVSESVSRTQQIWCFRPSHLTSHPQPPEDAHRAEQKHFLAARDISSSSSPSGFPHALGGPPREDTSQLTENPSSGSGSPYPDPWTQGTMAGCQGESLNLRCVSVCVSRPVLSDSLWPYSPQPASSSIHGILQARILKRVAIPFSMVCICEYLHGEDP